MKFEPLSVKSLLETLELTIKSDAENKLATFLCCLSAYTDNSQFNISFNAPSSTGKSYIPTEIASLFPKEDVIEIAYCSPTAFFHDTGSYDKEKNCYLIDLSHKILIFLDQPHSALLAHLRPILSHDKKEIELKNTDKSQRHGLKTKNVLMRGYPAVIFCTAGLTIDEQEATRFLLLSPETNQQKILQSITATIDKESNNELFMTRLYENHARSLLKERIAAIKHEEIREINIPNSEQVKSRFIQNHNFLKPRHQRDVKRLLSLIKSFALLNLWWRKRDGKTIYANEQDVDAAFALWNEVSESQDFNLPPYILNLFREIIVPAWNKKNFGKNGSEMGLTRQEILEEHVSVYGRMLDINKLRLQILPMLEIAGLIEERNDSADFRKILIYIKN